MQKLAPGWPPEAHEFVEYYAGVESRMKRGRFAARKARAEANWTSLVDAIDPAFIKAIADAGKANTLISKPPHAFMADGTWQRKNPAPLETVGDLLLRGVCQVRNNLEHGDKFIGPEGDRQRDMILISEAYWVIKQIVEILPELAPKAAE